MKNIPIHRANKINSNDIVIGFLTKKNYDNQKVRYFILEDKNIEVAMTYEIDPSTLSLNFEDMLDSQGNKIFASLSEDGKGGDIMRDDEYYGVAKYKDSRFVVEYENVEECLDEGNFEVIGIQE